MGFALGCFGISICGNTITSDLHDDGAPPEFEAAARRDRTG